MALSTEDQQRPVASLGTPEWDLIFCGRIQKEDWTNETKRRAERVEVVTRRKLKNVSTFWEDDD